MTKQLVTSRSKHLGLLSPKYPCGVCGRLIADVTKGKHLASRLCAAYARTRELQRTGYIRCKSSARPIECAGISVVRDLTVYVSPGTAARGDPQFHVIKVPWAPCWAVLIAESCGRLPYQEYKRNQLRRKLMISAAYDPSWRDTLEAIYKLGGDQKAIDEIVHKAAMRFRK